MIATIIVATLNLSPPIYVYDQIKANKPSLPEWYVLRLSSVINNITAKYNIPKRLYTAILMQESGYKLDAKNCTYGKCMDFGIGQIHKSSIRRYKLSKEKILNNLEYSVEAGVRILSDFRDMYGKKEREYWTRYNSSNNSARQLYAKRVLRWL